MISYVVY